MPRGARSSSAPSPTSPSPDKLSPVIAQHWRVFLLVVVALSALLMGLTFDPKVSIGGDDSWYLLAAQDFWNGIAFPSWHGAFYSILLSPLIALWGLALVPLKLLSVLFALASVWILGVAFRKRLAPLPWLCGLTLCAITPSFVILGSTTYSEPLFLLLQSGIFYALFTYEALPVEEKNARKGFIWLVALGILTLLLALTRNVGYGAFFALLIYFFAVARDKIRGARVFGVTFLGLLLLFNLYRRLWWGVTDASFSGQLARALQVDFYNAAAGQEDFWGMLTRFALNCKQYLGYHNFHFLGFPVTFTPYWTVTVLLVALLLFLLVKSWRREKTLTLLGIYLAAMYGVTFITQQVSWNQERLVLVYFPLFLFFVLGGILYFLRHAGLRVGLLVLFFISFFALLFQTGQRVDVLRIRANLQGDRYAGYTPDWESYLKMSEWVGTHLPDSVVVACRKPNNSRIYGNRPFFGVFKLPGEDAASIRDYLDSNHVAYAMCGRLRRYTEQRTDEFINTMHIMLSYVLREQPDYLELVHYEGSSEPTFLFKIHREARSGSVDDQRQRLQSGLYVYQDNPEAYYRLANLSLAERRPDEAHEYLLEAIKLFEAEKLPLPPALRETLGMIRFAKGEFDVAIAEFEALTQEYPTEARLWYNLGVCYQRIGDPRAAACLARGQQGEGAPQ
ncbi:MAG: tetratricopeptide repeat protein [Bacteroides sp.]